MAGTCTLTLLSSQQADKVTDMFVSGLIHEALVQLTDTLRFFVRPFKQSSNFYFNSCLIVYSVPMRLADGKIILYPQLLQSKSNEVRHVKGNELINL